MIGTVLSHYRIESSLGEGGMGAVYLARDLALGRSTALKVVAGAGGDQLAPRLLREAEASARLQHPAIATFYESGEVDGRAFIAMEYVRGRTLRDVLSAGPLTLERTIESASALLEALNHAHAAGILHRDIKPENIIITPEGTPKLLDFGLSRALMPAAETDDTVQNLTGDRIIGTVGYMSPEQLRGEALDAASDLFALGAVIYEMAAGRPAFGGGRATERIAAILTGDPTPLAGQELSRRLWPVAERSLKKDRSGRYGSAAEMLSALRAISDASAAPAPSGPQSLAVINFRNLSRQADDDWIGSGVAETIAADLARVPGLTVVGREKLLAVQRTRGDSPAADPAADALALGSLLGCRWLLLGSYQRLGGRLRLTAQLTEVATGAVASAEKLDGPLDSLFDMQDRLSQAVRESLDLRTAPASALPRDVQAFEYYARGRRLFLRLEKGTFEQAGELYRKAIAQDPEYAPALSGLAGLHAMRFVFTTDTAELERAADYARRAIAADPTLADPHVWLGYALMRMGQLDEALAEELKGAELDPANGYPPYFAGCAHHFAGRPADAIPYFQRAVTREPPHGFAWIGLAACHADLGNLNEAKWCIERAIALEDVPGAAPTVGAAGFLGECLRLMGRLDEARAASLSGLEATERSDHMYRHTYRAVALCALGRTALDQGDTAAAHAAFSQVLAQIRGRERTLGGGFLVVQALAGLARAGGGARMLSEARQLLQVRDRYNFAIVWLCDEPTTMRDVRAAEEAVARMAEAK